ncbi:MAG: phosphatidylglycerophosphatase A [Acidobacteriota bacterium]|nr:phosphatidylglycerophosphatase A [Acidobacteriota bacterium]
MEEKQNKKTFLDYFSVAFSTFGVGFIPLAPGTWGSAVGIFIFLLTRRIELNNFASNFPAGKSAAFIYALNAVLLLAFSLLGIWTSSRAAKIFQKKDPQKVVVDEVIGQLIVFFFVPFDISWKLILAGFLLFRLFDIWKPYPVREFETLSEGLGICADDIVAGIYGGICLAVIYAVSIFF